MSNILVLEEWKKSGYRNRLVTNGRRIWLEYQPKYSNGYGVGQPEWSEDPTNQSYWLINFNTKERP